MTETTDDLDKILSVRRQAESKVIEVDEPTRKFVIFTLGEECFAIAGEHIREILPMGRVFFVPGCPPTLEGVINVRGDIVSVISLFTLLGKSPPTSGSEESILLGHAAGMQSGLRVGRVLDVLDLRENQIQEPHATLSQAMARIVTGISMYAQRPISILDLNRLFEDYQRALSL